MAPPAPSRLLLTWAGRRLRTPDLAVDAGELFAERAGRDGERAARRWYRRQARAAVRRVLFPERRARRKTSLAGLLAGFALDVKLGVRMLVRYPGLTVVCGLAMAFAIAVGAGTFQFITDRIHPSLPLSDGERVIGINYWNRAESEHEAPIGHELLVWRQQLTTVEDVGGFRSLQRNLAAGEGAGEPVELAEISAAGFRVARVPPLLGRVLVDADEEPGALPMVVLGYQVWQRHFGGDPAMVNRTVWLGGAPVTVVGVMPEGFAFPIRHSVWIPLPSSELRQEPGRSRPLRVFGRVAPWATPQEAEAEVATLAVQLAADFPDRYEHLRPEVSPYAESILGNFFATDGKMRALVYSINVFPALFLILVCGNVGLLQFARAATRERELLVRSALGAGRGRIVLQLFVEALVLGALAAAVGLPAARLALQWALEAFYGVSRPFWVAGGLSATTVAYAGLLTLLAAALAGVVPALKVTGRRMETRARQASAAAGGPRLGLTWQGMIVVQVAATVVFAAVAYLIQRQAGELLPETVGFEAEQYLIVPLEIDPESQASLFNADREGLVRRYAAMVEELERRLAAEPAVVGVTVAERFPLMDQPRSVIELDGGEAAHPTTRPAEAEHTRPGNFFVNTTAVAPGFFEAFGAPIVSGRLFDARDLLDGANTLVVNESFATRILGGRSPIGRRIRYIAAPDDTPGPWYEIVGVVRNLVRDRKSPLVLDAEIRAQLYHPLSPGRLPGTGAGRPWRYPLHVAVQARGDTTTLAPAVRRVAAEVSATLRLDIHTLDQLASEDARFWRFWSRGILLVNAIALALSLAGIYSVLSFTVARRTREIGVRVALGASSRRVVAEIFRKPLRLVVAGVTVGCLVVGAMLAFLVATVGMLDGLGIVQSAGLLGALGVATVAVCGIACIGPAWRALRVEPTDALRAEV